MKKLRRNFALGGDPQTAYAYDAVIGAEPVWTSPKVNLSRPTGGWSGAGAGSTAAGNAAGVVGGVATLGTGLINAIDSPNQYGNPSTAASTGTGALSGAATGAVAGSVVPGIGTAVGAVVGGVVGGVTGWLKGKSMRRKEKEMFRQSNDARRRYDEAVSNAIIQDPGLVQGYKGATYFKNGGNLNYALGGPGPAPSDSTRLSRPTGVIIDNPTPYQLARTKRIQQLSTEWGVPTNQINSQVYWNYGDGPATGGIPRRVDWSWSDPATGKLMRNKIDYNEGITRGYNSSDYGVKAMGGPLNVDSTLQANRRRPFVDRILNADRYPVRKNSDGTVSTHLMATAEDDLGPFAYPTLRLINGQWIEDKNPAAAAAVGDTIHFNTNKAADYFTKNYKKVKSSKLLEGGPLEQDPNKKQVADKRYKELYGPVEDRLNKAVEKIGYEKLPKGTQQMLNLTIGQFDNTKFPSGRPRNIPPMDDVLRGAQQKFNNLTDEQIEGFLKTDWSAVKTFPQLLKNKPKGVSLLDLYKYYNEYNRLKKEKYTFETGGNLNKPVLAEKYMSGGYARSLSSNATELVGNSHAQGGIQIPDMNAEVEGGETTAGNFVFSKKLGFAGLHKPIAKAIGLIEKKPQTRERVEALRRLRQREQELAAVQEQYKADAGII